ncbi:MAG: hypothetical protein BWK79_02110 [Beggiatoa sp. IS2]|nr:MAG: hypothetical protein BWK79_02110 [Beggiatoa sp. IS2]
MKTRHPERKHLCLYLAIIDQHTGGLLGHLGDISKNGIMIIGDKPLLPKQIRDVSIKLPDFEEFSKRTIDIKVEVRWTKPDTNPDLFCSGCRFLEIIKEDLLLIEQAEEVLGFDG